MEEVLQLPLWIKIVGCVVPLLIIILNSIEIHMLKSTRNKAFYEKILLSLTICDLMTGIYGIFWVPLISHAKVEICILYWIGWTFLGGYCTINSIMHLVIISMDRLWAVAAPLHHRRYASNRKLFGVIAISWSTPSIYTLANITIVIIRKLDLHKLYSYTTTSMAKHMAVILTIANLVLVISYSAIILVIWRQKSKREHYTQARQRQFMNTIILCMCIALVFVTASTPYLVAHIVDWNRPVWLRTLSMFLFPMNQILNSLLYMIQKIRTKARIIITKNNQNINADMEGNAGDIELWGT